MDVDCSHILLCMLRWFTFVLLIHFFHWNRVHQQKKNVSFNTFQLPFKVESECAECWYFAYCNVGKFSLKNDCICGGWDSDQCSYLAINIFLTVLKARELIQKKKHWLNDMLYKLFYFKWNELCLITKFGPNLTLCVAFWMNPNLSVFVSFITFIFKLK